MKTLLKYILLLGLTAYLVFVFIKLPGFGTTDPCRSLKVTIVDSAHAGFITAEEVERLLRKSHAHPVGKPMDNIDSRALEQLLRRNPYIREATCYKTPGERVNLLISQRLPFLRIMAENGENYYIDEKGYTLDPMGYVADLVVATGNIDKQFTRQHLVKLGRFLRDHEFWERDIVQINVDAEREIDLVPRVGNQIIHIGRPDSLERKFKNLRAFYEKVVPTVGWNKYTRINVEHTNQIICTKK